MGKRRSQREQSSPSHECALPPGEGNPQAELVFVGAAASELLIKMIEAMGLKREQVYLTQLSSCPGCNALLERKLEEIKPKVIVALGEEASRTLLKSEAARGMFQELHGIRLMPTFHPDELLSSPASKREAWAHLQQVARELGLKLPSKTEKKA